MAIFNSHVILVHCVAAAASCHRTQLKPIAGACEVLRRDRTVERAGRGPNSHCFGGNLVGTYDGTTKEILNP